MNAEGPIFAARFDPPKPIHWIVLALVVIAAAAMRFADLEHRPDGLFRDEAEKGYNGWALATTGGMLDLTAGRPGEPRAIWRPLPWMANVFGTRTSAIYQYASVPFMKFGGLTVATTRMAAALAGTLAVFAIGWLFMRAWGSAAGLLAAAWLAMCPWHLVFSRWALQGIFVPLLILVALAGLYGWERKRSWGLPLAAAGLGWLFYAYSGAQPFALAWGFCLAIIYRRALFSRETWKSWEFLLAAGLFIMPVAPTVAVLLSPNGAERMGRVGIWSDPEIRGWRIPLEFLANYFKHFDPRFLFISGDANPRHGIPGMGELTLADAILLPAGLFWSFRRRERLTGALIAAFLCGPIPAALTREGVPHALRALPMVVPCIAWSAYAMAAGSEWLAWKLQGSASASFKPRMVVGLLLAALMALGASGFARYWRLAGSGPLVQAAFEKGQREAWEAIASGHKRGQRVWVNGYLPYSVYCQLFFLRIPPKSVGPEGPGVGDFIYYDPSGKSLEQLRRLLWPGDWLLYPIDPSALEGPEGEPLISPEEAARVQEPWVAYERKP